MERTHSLRARGRSSPCVHETCLSLESWTVAYNHWMKAVNSLRVAVDIIIWMFQIHDMDKRVESRPENLLLPTLSAPPTQSWSIICVWRHHTPPMKRHRDTIQFRGQAWEIQQVKQVILPFGFCYRDPPSEAEAYCTLLPNGGEDACCWLRVGRWRRSRSMKMMSEARNREGSQVIFYEDVQGSSRVILFDSSYDGPPSVIAPAMHAISG